MKQWIMLKDVPVLEIDQYTCTILDYQHLPVSLRYQDVNYDDIMHGWTELRTMNIGKTNGKKILSACGINQNNPYTLARACHFASVTDCYWIKDETEDIGWQDINLFRNPLEQVISRVALLGTNDSLRFHHNIHTPELTVQGMAAKAWIRESDGLYLYKVAKKELAADQILTALGIDHVHYEEVFEAELGFLADEKRLSRIREADEKIVKCKSMTSEQRSIITWEDFAIYMDRNERDPFELLEKNTELAEDFYRMQIADYILGNEDRHMGNYGFYVDNETGDILSMHPLMDHDHAFCDDEDLISQTSPTSNVTLKEAARIAVKKAHLVIPDLRDMERPAELTAQQWENLLARTRECQRME